MKIPAAQIIALITFSSLVSSCNQLEEGLVPEDWHVLPEYADHEVKPPTIEEEDAFGKRVDEVVKTQREALEEVEAHELAISGAQDIAHPKDWVPWHLEYLITEFSLSAKGVLGSLILKGTPSVSAYWRRQYPKPHRGGPPEAFTSGADVLLTDEFSPEDLSTQLEPSIQAALRSGRVKDERALRANLMSIGAQFRDLALQLAQTEKGEWWVSRFRMDISVDAEGKVSPLVTLGGDIRFRFEWHRLKRSLPSSASSGVALRVQPVKPQLDQFVRGMIRDLQEVSLESEKFADAGYKAYSFRVGVGFSAKGDLAIAKTSTTVFGHLNFSRDVRKPVVNPYPSPTPMLADLRSVREVDDGATLPLLGETHRNEHLHLASASEEPLVVHEVKRSKFRSGLKQATAIGGFFARRLAKASMGKWKVYEFRTGFDVSLSGKLGMAEIAGAGAAQINFYNGNF